MCVHVCYENVFALQLHVDGVQVRSDVRQKGQASEPSRVEELTNKDCDLLVQVTHTGQHGSLTQPENFAKVKQIAVLHVDQCLELFFSSVFLKYLISRLIAIAVICIAICDTGEHVRC